MVENRRCASFSLTCSGGQGRLGDIKVVGLGLRSKFLPRPEKCNITKNRKVETSRITPREKLEIKKDISPEFGNYLESKKCHFGRKESQASPRTRMPSFA